MDYDLTNYHWGCEAANKVPWPGQLHPGSVAYVNGWKYDGIDVGNYDHVDGRGFNLIGVSHDTETGKVFIVLELCFMKDKPCFMLCHITLDAFLRARQSGHMRFNEDRFHLAAWFKTRVKGEVERDPLPGIYRHWKQGGLYNCFGCSEDITGTMTSPHTDPPEEEWRYSAVYQPLYGPHYLMLRQRPVVLFADDVDRAEPISYKGKRFTLVEPFPEPRFLIAKRPLAASA